MKPTSIPIPERMRKLAYSPKWGLPVPFFVSETNGEEPDFRIASSSAWTVCVNDDLCWVCGSRLGAYRSFAIGPMCAINRVGSDPPMHLECAEYSVRVCPFMLNPSYARREKDRPADYELSEVPGVMIERNPGVTLVWTTRKAGYYLERAPNGWLFRLSGEPENVSWWALGRAATRAEVEHSMETGLPILQKMAEEDGPKAVELLDKMKAQAQRLLPAA